MPSDDVVLAGYPIGRRLSDGRLVAIQELTYGRARLVANVTLRGYDEHW